MMNAFDSMKWLIVLLLIVLGAWGNFSFSEQPLYLRVLGELLIGGIAAAIAFQTEKGRKAWNFLGEAKLELRKVVWSNRKETTQATLLVLGAVVLVAVFLWVLDAILGRMAAWVVG